MYYTPAGGDIMFVEALRLMPAGGRRELRCLLTGQLGDVMKESARAALTYARSHARGPRHRRGRTFDRDVHIHVPAGAIPKDGPSAGIAMATALVSALSGRPVRHDVAMTGEITLRGRVLPIGGLKEKSARRAPRRHHRSRSCPRRTRRTWRTCPRRCASKIQVYPVSELGEVLALTLRGASFREGRLLFGEEKPGDVAPLAAYHH